MSMGLSSLRAMLLFGLAIASGAASARGIVAQETHLLVVGGLGGDEENRTRFLDLGIALVEAGESSGVDARRITFLAERPERDPARIDGESRREDVEAAFSRIADAAGPDDRIFVVLLGHGSFERDEARFNLPGPDLSAVEFGLLLDRFQTQKVVFVNTASASGAFLSALAGPNRTLVTATRSGMERNLTRFPEHFVAAYAGDGADADRNGRVSVLEAFEYARRETERSYASQNQLATEHPVLDDNADGVWSDASESGGEGRDGQLARTLFLSDHSARVAADTAAAGPELRRLLRERAILEEQVAELREQKEFMEESVYEARLEALLLDLALKSREVRAEEIRARGGGQ